MRNLEIEFRNLDILKLRNENLELEFFKFGDLNKLRVGDGSCVKENKLNY